MAPKKMGRPLTGLPKDCDVKVRLDAETHEKLLQYSAKHKLTKAEAIRRGIHLLLDEK